MFKRNKYATERQLDHITNLIDSRIRRIDLLASRIRSIELRSYGGPSKYDVASLEAQVTVLQDIIVKAGLVEDYESPAEKGKTIYRLGDGLYTVKKGK